MANKKINQLVSKTSILGTDLFPLGDGTTGQLFKKTVAELQAAIGGAVISVNGLVGTVVLDTDDIQELASPTNRYFTDARARGAISLTVSGASGASTYNSSTGVLNIPTYTLAGLGGITASFLSGASGISYNSSTGVISYSGTVYNDALVRALFSGSTGISYNSATGAFSSTITQYTDALARASISGAAPITYNSSTGAIGITQASGSTNGYLSSTDWTTFNSKQSTLSGGTSGYATFWTGSSTLGADSAFFWDNTNKRLGIGSVTPDSALQVYFNSTTTTFTDIAHVGSGAGKSLFVSTNAYGFSLNDSASRAGWGITTDSDGGFMRFHYGASEKVRIISSGNVGIGMTTDLFYKLNVYGEIFAWNLWTQQSAWTIGTTTSSASITGFGSTGFGGITNTLVLNTNGAERMRVLNDGRVAVGTNTTIFSSKFQVQQNSSGGVMAHFYDSAIDTGYYWSAFSNLVVIEARTIAGSVYRGISNLPYGGNFLIGTLTDNGERLYVSGNIRATGTITANSDITLKKNLAKIENALEKVEQINGYTYEFKADDSKRHAGVIAQEIQGVLPEIVNKGNDGILGVEYGNISALLIEAIKDLKIKNETLVARLEALEK